MYPTSSCSCSSSSTNSTYTTSTFILHPPHPTSSSSSIITPTSTTISLFRCQNLLPCLPPSATLPLQNSRPRRHQYAMWAIHHLPSPSLPYIPSSHPPPLHLLYTTAYSVHTNLDVLDRSEIVDDFVLIPSLGRSPAYQSLLPFVYSL